MHTQHQPVQSVDISVPEILSNSSFKFSAFFAIGGEKTTNISRRLGSFDRAFYDVANNKCKMPPAICFKDVPRHSVDTIMGILPRVQTSDQLWPYRVPIKLIGYLKDQQKTGEPGLLLVNGDKNIFLSRNNWDVLEVIELTFQNGSWAIYSREWSHNYVLEGPCRFFYACRHSS